MSTIQDVGLTADEFLTMPDEGDCELVDGELRERVRSTESSWIAGQIFRRIANVAEVRRAGWVFPGGIGFQCFEDDPNRVRKADCALITRSRLPGGPVGKGFARTAPDLVVEVVSPHDTAYEVEEKLMQWLEAGVREVWIVMSPQRTVTIHRAGEPPRTLHEGDSLEIEQLVPGFRCQVRGFFPPVKSGFPDSN